MPKSSNVKSRLWRSIALAAGAFFTVSAVAAFAAGTPTYSTTWTTSDPNIGLSWDSAGHVWAAGGTGNDVVEYDSSGAVLARYTPGLDFATGVAVGSGGDVWVSDTNHARVVHLDSAGSVIGAIGVSAPEDVAVDGLGNVYVATYWTQSIEEFTSTGTHLQSFALPGQYGLGVAVDSAGNVYGSSYNGNSGAPAGTVTKFSPGGAVLASTTAVTVPERLRIDTASGSVYVPDSASGDVALLSLADLSLQSTLGSGLLTPHAVALTNGKAYITSGYDIVVYNLNQAPPPPPPGPTTTAQCKNDGWRSFTSPAFKNQGDCVSFVASKGKNK